MTSAEVVEFPPFRSGEDVVISATTYQAYMRCPEQASGRLRGVYGPESRASFSGHLAHRVFARHLSGGAISDDGFELACREEMGESMNPKLGSLKLKPSDIRGIIAETRELYERFKTMRHEGFVGAEQRLEASVGEGVTLRGSIDAVYEADGGYRLVDWKTRGLGEPAHQMAFYALLWTIDRGELPVALEAVSVGTGERTEEVPGRVLVVETAGHIASLVNDLRGSWELAVSADRHAGPWCSWCPLLDECDEGRSAQRLLG